MTRKKIILSIVSLLLIAIAGLTINYFRPIKRIARHYDKGLLYVQRAQHQAAIREFKAALAIQPNLNIQLSLAKAYVSNENFDKAQQELENIIGTDKNFKFAYTTLAGLFLQQQQYANGLEVVNRFLEVKSDSVPILNLKARILLAQKKPNLAKEALLKAKKLDPKQDETHSNLATAEWQAENKNAAIQVLEEYINAFPKNVSLRLQLASYYFNIQDQLKAIENFKILQDNGKKIPGEYLGTYVMSLVQSGDIDRAYKIANKFLEKNKRSPQKFLMTYVRGVAHLSQKKYNAANKDLLWVTAAQPDFALGRYYMGLTYLLQKNYLLASEELQKAIDLDPKATAIHNVIIQSYAAEDKLDECLKICEEMLRNDRNNIVVLNMKARILMLMGETEKAQQLYAAIAKASPNSARSEMQLAIVDLRNKKENKAIYRLKAAMKKNPNDPTIPLFLAQIYFAKNNLLPALKYLNQSIDSGKQKTPASRRMLARIRLAQRYYDLAAEEYESLLQDYPRNDVYCLRLASIYFQQGKIDKVTEFLQSKNKTPQTHPAYTQLYAQIYLQQKRYDDAIKLIDASDNANLKILKGNILSFLKKYPQAVEAYQEAKDLNDQLNVENYIGFCYYYQKDWAKAIDHFEAFVEKSPNNVMRTFIAILFAYSKDLTSTKKILNNVLKENKDNILANLVLANTFLMEGEQQKATEQLKQISTERTFIREQFAKLISDCAAKNTHFLPLIDGIIFERIASRDQAIARYEEIMRELDSHYLVEYYYSIYLYRVAKTEDVINRLQKLIATGNLSEEAYSILAGVYLREQKTQKAQEVYSKILKINPKNSDALIKMGMIHELNKKYPQAVSFYKKLIDIPNNNSKIIALNNLAYIYATKQQDSKKAISYAKQAYDLAQSSWEIADTLGYIYYTAGKYPLALKYLQYSSQLYPKSSEVQFHLAQTYFKMRNKTKCKYHLNRAFKVNNRFTSRKQAEQMRKKLGF
ncbi:tetratricopeptide repeat protein [Candidatus Uabimicrobium amorphum]|uniref:Lipoprotein n=1 Tax=Uabimicrobium amorphum TaxID=2596890 RepID=A0A5S9F4A0_UABAM|nr:tetratricopeptide repeat protein [Candidatus Uabimicrobium amorphum]BBM85081.1 lipoprotein [Candidatus Uabimicrobium amorphum]